MSERLEKFLFGFAHWNLEKERVRTKLYFGSKDTAVEKQTMSINNDPDAHF